MGDLVGSIAGPVFGYLGAKKQAAATENAARMQADAAREAADMARFRPVGITTGFGSSQFTTDDKGNVTGASYQLTPELAAIRDRLMSQAGAYDPTAALALTQPLTGAAQSLFGLGSQYLAASPQEAARNYISGQQALLGPQREQQLAGLRNRLFQTGRTGLATGGTVSGNMAQTNPELAAYYNSIANQDLTLAANADQASKQNITFGAGLFGTGGQLGATVPQLLSSYYSPLQTQLGTAGTVEGLGQQSLELGSALGGRQATAGAAAGNLLNTGSIYAGKTLAGITDPTAALLGSFGRQIGSGTPTASSWFNSMLGGGPNYGTTGNLAGSSSAFNPAVNYSGSYDPAAGSTSWYD
jgi:hypothetical protein